MLRKLRHLSSHSTADTAAITGTTEATTAIGTVTEEGMAAMAADTTIIIATVCAGTNSKAIGAAATKLTLRPAAASGSAKRQYDNEEPMNTFTDGSDLRSEILELRLQQRSLLRSMRCVLSCFEGKPGSLGPFTLRETLIKSVLLEAIKQCESDNAKR